MSRLLVVGALIIFLLAVASATNNTTVNTSLTEIFGNEDSSILPPEVEGIEGSQPSPQAEESTAGNAAPKAMFAEAATDDALGPEFYTVILEIEDINTGNLITDAHIRLMLDDGEDTLATLRFVGEDGKMDLQLSPGSWSLTLRLDITSTVGKDYYSYLELMVNRNINQTVFMQPVGSLMGEVIDENNNLIPDASIKFNCGGDYGHLGTLNTDEFGSFSADWLPVGSCRVSALNGNKAGSANVQIAQGQLSEVTITLSKGVAPNNEDYTWMAALIGLILAIAGFLIYRRKKKPTLPEEPAEPVKRNGHMDNILHAIDENERRIVEALMEEGGKSQQNKLGRKLDMPKSSLSRAVSGLASRDIVKTEKLGRIKRIELSEWFLNGKKP
jgi:LPXTG-motif cell wall-anchored protein